MTQESFYSTPQIPAHNLNARNMMKNMKTPYLSKIEELKSNFSQKKQNHIIDQASVVLNFENRQSKRMPSLATFSSQDITQRIINQHQRIVTQSSFEDLNQKQKEVCCPEWTLGTTPDSRFPKLDQMVQHYNRVFERKIKFSNGGRYGGDSFKAEEKLVIQQIYDQIANHQEHTVNFEEVHKFFKKCSLFFRIYNIHPDSLQDVLNESAHHYEDRLTEEEFLNFFLLNNRTNQDYQNYNIERIFKKCVLEEQSWKEMKDIFDLFDTFGNQKIEIKKLFRKLKNCHQYSHLLKQDVIYFPNIKRYYSMKKVLFELENKLNICDKICEWQEIKALITNFSHIREPTIDVIVKDQISSGIISSMSNNFMLKQSILNQIKQIYARCPKYCLNFIKVSQFCGEVFQNMQDTSCMRQIVRKQPQITTFKSVLICLMNQPYQYLDLDQILQWFSIKGYQNYIKEQKKVRKRELSLSSESDEENQFNFRRRREEKNKKNINNLPKKYAKIDQKSEVTVVKEFKLSKKTKQSIRDQKVQKMIEEQKVKQMEECSKKFKAHPIPASINNEKYEEYRATMDIHKELSLAKLQAKNEKERITLQYLQANTKLFEKPKVVEEQPQQEYVFKAEPVPWFVQMNLLDQINAEKQVKLKKLKKENTLKYLKDWKNLPTFLYDPSYESTPDVSREGTNRNFESDKVNESSSNIKREKSKVKQIPDFKALHQNFQEQLDLKKKHFNPTVTQEFKLSSPRVKPIEIQRPSSARASHRKSKNSPSKAYFIGSTLKFESLVKHTQEKKVFQEMKKQQEEMNQKSRKTQKQIFAKMVRKQLKKQCNKQLKSTGSTMRSKKAGINSKNMQNSKQLADIYRRVFSRPFLFQSSSKNKGQNKYIEKKARPVQMEDYGSAELESQFIEKIYPSEFINDSNLIDDNQHESEVFSRRSI